MVVKFLAGGKSSAIVHYVLKNSTAREKEVLKGRGIITEKLINSGDYSSNYEHIVLSEDKKLTTEEWKNITDKFLEDYMIGYEKNEYDSLIVQHDNEHCHIVIPRLSPTLDIGLRNYNDKSDRDRVNLIRDNINDKFGLSDPSDLTRKKNKEDRTITEEIEFYRTKYEPERLENLKLQEYFKTRKSIKKFTNEINQIINFGIDEGHIKNQMDTLETVRKIVSKDSRYKIGDYHRYDNKFKNDKNKEGRFFIIEDTQDNKKHRIPCEGFNNDRFNIRNSRTQKPEERRTGNREEELGKLQEKRREEISKRVKPSRRKKEILQQEREKSFQDRNDMVFSNVGVNSNITEVDSGNLLSEKRSSDSQKTVSRKDNNINRKRTSIRQRSKQFTTINYMNQTTIQDTNKRDIQIMKFKDRIKEIKQSITIEQYTRSLGVGELSPTGKNGFLTNSPLRKDTKPSFLIDNNTGKWTDLGTNESGDIFDLHMKINNCNMNDSINDLSNLLSINSMEKTVNNMKNMDIKIRNHTKQKTPDKKEKSTFEEISLSGNVDRHNREILTYVKTRGIKKIPDWLVCLKEKTPNNNIFSYVGVKNDSGGMYTVRNNTGKGFKGNKTTNESVGKNTITTIDNGSKTTVIVEGMLDATSWYQIQENNVNYIILNSTGNYKDLKFNPEQHYIIGLDNDSSGIKTTNKIIENFSMEGITEDNLTVSTPHNEDWNLDLLDSSIDCNIKMNVEKVKSSLVFNEGILKIEKQNIKSMEDSDTSSSSRHRHR